MIEKPPLHIVGMHGMGDNIHQRALINHLLPKYEIWLETPWPQIYHDLPVHLINTGSRLRTQSKNAKSNADKFKAIAAPDSAEIMRVFYSPEHVRAKGSVLRAMLAYTGTEIEEPDYRLPIPPEWRAKADALLWGLNVGSKPIMIARPLVTRKEWGGCAARNPDYTAYGALYESIRKDFFVVSIADVVPGTEWIVGPDLKADAEFHHGELDFETIAALTARDPCVRFSGLHYRDGSIASGSHCVCIRWL